MSSLNNANLRQWSPAEFEQIMQAQTVNRNKSPMVGTIRGLTNVGPLAQYKFHNLELDSMTSRYFPAANFYELSTDNYIIVDPDCDCEKLLMNKESKRFYYVNSNTTAFNVYVFTSTDATKLAECYDCVNPSDNEVLLFIEDNKGDDISDQYAAVKIAPNLYREKALIGGIQNDLKSNRHLHDFIKGAFPAMSMENINDLMNTGKLENKTIVKIATVIEKIMKLNPLNILPEKWKEWMFDNMSIQAKLSPALGKLVYYIRKAKVDDYDWNPEAYKFTESGNVDYSYDPKKDFAPRFTGFLEDDLNAMDDAKANELMRSMAVKLKGKLTEWDSDIREKLGIDAQFEIEGGRKSPNDMQEFFYQKYREVIRVLDKKLSDLEQADFSDMVKKGLRMFNAFICGVWNSLVEMVAGFVLMIKMIFDAIALLGNIAMNLRTELPILLEHFDNLIQAIQNIDFGLLFAAIKNRVVKIATQLVTSISLEEVAYFAGAFVGFIITLVIEIVAGILFTGGTLTVAAIMQKLAEIFSTALKAMLSTIKKVGKGIEKIVVTSAKALRQVLRALTEFFQQPPDALLQFIDDLFKAFRRGMKEGRGTLNAGVKSLVYGTVYSAETIARVFYRQFKIYLHHYKANKAVLMKWQRFVKLGYIKRLSRADMNDLINLRKLNKRAYNKNAATFKAKIEVDGKIKEIEFKALAGDRVNGDGLCKNVRKDYLIKQLNTTSEKIGEVYNDVNRFKKPTPRFYDSEHKILDAFDEYMNQLKTNFAHGKVKVLEMEFKSLYEPCTSCKRQIIIRQEMYNAKLNIEAVLRKKNGFVKGNEHLQEVINQLK